MKKSGYKQKKFDAANREDFSGVAWEVGMAYKPVSYSQFRLSTTADTRETNGLADYIRSRTYTLNWEHSWVDRLSTNAEILGAFVFSFFSFSSFNLNPFASSKRCRRFNKTKTVYNQTTNVDRAQISINSF